MAEEGMTKDKIIGLVSLFLGVIIIVGVLIGYAITIFVPLYLIAFFGTFYKTVVKKKKLRKSEWIGLAFLIFIGYILPYILVFLVL